MDKNKNYYHVNIFMKNVPGNPKYRELTKPLLIWKQNGEEEQIPTGFIWNGSSVPWPFKGIFPRHKHPVASSGHDYRWNLATSKEDLDYANAEFKKMILRTKGNLAKFEGFIGKVAVTANTWWQTYIKRRFK